MNSTTGARGLEHSESHPLSGRHNIFASLSRGANRPRIHIAEATTREDLEPKQLNATTRRNFQRVKRAPMRTATTPTVTTYEDTAEGMDGPERERRLLRQRIDQLLEQKNYDGIGNLPGFRIVDRTENRSPKEYCSGYVFGNDKGIGWGNIEEKDNVIGTYNKVNITDAQKGDMVVYFDDQGNYQHVGFAEGNNRVRSRFGIAHVYEHPA
jgi:hypothetical protein